MMEFLFILGKGLLLIRFISRPLKNVRSFPEMLFRLRLLYLLELCRLPY